MSVKNAQKAAEVAKQTGHGVIHKSPHPAQAKKTLNRPPNTTEIWNGLKRYTSADSRNRQRRSRDRTGNY